jgi:hypothetical protein
MDWTCTKGRETSGRMGDAVDLLREQDYTKGKKGLEEK